MNRPAKRPTFEQVKARRFELLDHLHALNRIDQGAQKAGSSSPYVWDALAVVYRERPLILAELAILEDSPPTELIRFLAMNPADSKREIDRVVIRGGVFDAGGRFAEVTGP
jgi:inosine-uridine nucleoside N-ribohydrolase